MVTAVWETTAGAGSGAGWEMTSLGTDVALVTDAASESAATDVTCGEAVGTVSGDEIEETAAGVWLAAGVRA